MVKTKWQNWKKTETGQSLVEFAIILPILVLLMTLPVDFFRYINTKMILNSAATECIGQLTYASVSSSSSLEMEEKIRDMICDYYGDRLDNEKVQITFTKGNHDTEDYTYYVYSSLLAGEANFGDRFEGRSSSYQCQEVQVDFSYQMSPITYWGEIFLGDTFDIQTPAYNRKLYAGGYMGKP